MVLIDGPHCYPWPEFEYSFFYHLLNEDGFMIIDDIHIPTIRNMFSVLCEDDKFYLDSVVLKTAFFRRSTFPGVPPERDNWYSQRYNIQQFPAPNPLEGTPVANELVLPAAAISSLKPYIKRGFTSFDGKLVTEGRLSMLEISFEALASGKCKIKIEIEPLFSNQRPDAGCEIYINHQLVKKISFEKAERLTINCETLIAHADRVEIKIHHLGTKHYDTLEHKIPPVMVDQRSMNFAITAFELGVKG